MPSKIPDGETRGWIVPIGGAENKENDRQILERFVRVSGGTTANIVVIPTASRMHETGPRYEQLFKQIGAAEARGIAQRLEELPQFFDGQSPLPRPFGAARIALIEVRDGIAGQHMAAHAEAEHAKQAPAPPATRTFIACSFIVANLSDNRVVRILAKEAILFQEMLLLHF